MSVVIRTATEDIELGPTVEVMKAWAELGKIDPGESELAYVPMVGDDEMPDEWLQNVKQQADQILRKPGVKMSPELRGYLETLAGRHTDAEHGFGGTE